MEAAGGVKIMGVVNVTADSFSDGGKFLDVDAAVVGTTAPLPEIIDDLRRGGVRPLLDELRACTRDAGAVGAAVRSLLTATRQAAHQTCTCMPIGTEMYGE